VVERFAPFVLFYPPNRPLVAQNRPEGGDSAHFENHWSIPNRLTLRCSEFLFKYNEEFVVYMNIIKGGI